MGYVIIKLEKERELKRVKTSTKIGLGLGVLAVTSVALTVIASEKIIKKVSHMSNRCQAKCFVNEKFAGNKKLLTIVDDLSEDELESIMNIIRKMKDSRKKISEYGESLKDGAENTKGRFMSFFEELI